MLKISAFSKLSRVSVKTLRFYDETGLLKPAAVDMNNGYRYYSEEQLLTVKRIVALKEQGFTLEQIKSLLEEKVLPDTVRSKLLDKKEELLRTIQEAQHQLDEINAKLLRMERTENQHKPSTITIRHVKPRLAASIRDVIPRSQLCLLLDEITQYVRIYGESDGNLLTILWHDYRSMNMDRADIEVALPLTKHIPSSDRVKVGLQPEWKAAASLVHRCDPYDNSCTAVAQLMSWISSNGYIHPDKEPIREIYLTSDTDMYGKLRLAELLIPVESSK
ncbi:MerR family transcriptional regulator [Paenibacillus alkalitolerans]|uniref:MerR family transcriptional regulator n=1 Tax=Paenibacillus alkalitolerans TaxID=2799335 RepID=UPI0018F46200|nr:MerR family transcriptional regulator [Paenibacillus alkalitolerans]